MDLVPLIEPHAPNKHRVRPEFAVQNMLRMRIKQWFMLGNPTM